MTAPLDDGGGGSGSSSGTGSYSIPLLRPQPQRHWQITPMPTEPPTPRSPSAELEAEKEKDKDRPVPRSRSFLNLTSSALFGIYGGRQFEDNSQPQTPWGAMTPASPESPRNSISEDAQRRVFLGPVDPAAYRSPPKYTTYSHGRRRPPVSPTYTLGTVCALATLGLLYGLVLAYIHAYTHVIPVRWATVEHHSSVHLAFWALAAVAAGLGLPALDRRWWGVSRRESSSTSGSSPQGQEQGNTVINAIRCVGGFVGIGFAIRKLPCEATVQAALTLTLSNPILWYLLDGSLTGLLLSTGTGVTGAAVLMGIQPAYEAPASYGTHWSSPPSDAAAGKANATIPSWLGPLGPSVAPEVLALAAYTGTALFYSVVSFGNVGRALAYR